VSAAPVQYARSGEVNVAYQVTGEGPFDLLLIHGFFSHLEIDWELPASRYVNDRLGSFARLIRFDKRGTGLSDRNVGVPDLESRMDDVRAVMDSVDSESAALFGYSEGGPLCALFAATYPERVRALVLYGTYAKRRDPEDDYPWAPTWDERVAIAHELEETWGSANVDLADMWPNPDEAESAWFGRRARASLSPAGVRDLILMNSQVDVRDILPTIQCPTLVLHRTGDRDASVGEGRYIAGRIPGARFVELPGDDHTLVADPRIVLDEVEEFLTGARPKPSSDRVLATILFTDLVGSTRRATELGDAAWAELLARHNTAIRTELELFDGEEIDTAGDGFLALFDGPARAIRCGLAIRDALAALGLDVRAGVHTGEVERPAGEKPRGIAVHVGARVMSLASAGEVFVSTTTRDLVAGSGLEFEDRGEHVLKGVEGPRRVYAVVG
jgi:pimeloyl-ACP methyl ester carboxylesterase